MTTARRKAPARTPRPAKSEASGRSAASAELAAKVTDEGADKARTETRQDPLIFSGPPAGLRAEVTVANTGDRRLAVRRLTVSRKGSADFDVQTAALVPPGTTASMPVTLLLDPATSPGDYPAEVQVVGVRRAAVLRVDPELAMRITPRRLLAEPGTHEISVVAFNGGNVDVPLAAVTKARTSDGGKEPGPDVTLTLPAPMVLAAASSVTLSGQLQVPTSLEPARRHTASVPVGLADLEVIILARSADKEAKS